MISRKDQDGSITHIIRWLSPLPPWIWDLYDPICLADRVKAELSKLRMTKMAVDCLPDDPADLAWYKHTNLGNLNLCYCQVGCLKTASRRCFERKNPGSRLCHTEAQDGTQLS